MVDEPLDTVVTRLAQRGVRLSGRTESARSVDIEDLDGNVITLWDAGVDTGGGARGRCIRSLNASTAVVTRGLRV